MTPGELLFSSRRCPDGVWGAQAGDRALQPLHRDPWPLPWGRPKGQGFSTEALVLREAARQREGPKLQRLETLIQSVLLQRLQAEGWRFI